jgi:hypothetical protein
MGIRHSNRIEDSLRQTLRETPGLEEELGDFFAEDKEERFFIKNLERVQGDERDAIILSVGYGKNQNGSLPLRFGPLLLDGGERRLNVAVTRAKHRVTLVTSFKASEVDLDRTNAEGVKLLCQYLQYVETGGMKSAGEVVVTSPCQTQCGVPVGCAERVGRTQGGDRRQTLKRLGDLRAGQPVIAMTAMPVDED